MTKFILVRCLALAYLFFVCHGFGGALARNRNLVRICSPTSLKASKVNFSRRSLLATATTLPFVIPRKASADFAPGGTLVEYEVGVQVGNEEASLSRKPNNSNVLFQQDYYFKFGTAARFIPPGSTEFPKTMPFVLSQQRYDNLKKYGDRVKKGVSLINSLIDVPEDEVIDPRTSDVYQLRPMGLLANGFLASENTGTTNELLLARYYINEMYLDIGDMINAPSQDAKKKSWIAAKKAVNSYYGMLNRSINAKVGDQFDLLEVK